MLGVIGLDTIGLDIPILRQVIGFIYLTFIPGALILRILNIHNIGTTKSFLYSVGLSIAFIMFTGALINSFLPSFCILRPISTLPLTATLTFLVAVLCGIAYIRDREFQLSGITYPNIKSLLSPHYLLLLLPLPLVVLGTLFINFYQNNILLLILFSIIALILAFIAFDRFTPDMVYALAIITIAISLLLHTALISPYPFGWNVDYEYYHQELVLKNGFWDSSLPHATNSLLSIVMLAPIYSLILNINIIWVLKAVYPVLFSFLPLALFAIYKEQLDTKRAFFSAFFFMTLSAFFSMIAFRRQMIGELFFVLLLVLVFDRKLTSIQKSALGIAFILSLCASYYGVAYVGLPFFFFALLFRALMQITSNKNWQAIPIRKLGRKIKENTANLHTPTFQYSILNIKMISIWAVFMLAWFMYISGGYHFNALVNLFQHICTNINEFMNPETRSPLVYKALGMGIYPASVLGNVYRVIHYITEAFIVVGVFKFIFRPKSFGFKKDYISFAVISSFFLFMAMFLPFFSTSWGTMRLYHFVLIFLSPFCVLGGEAVLRAASKLFNFFRLQLRGKRKVQQESTQMPWFCNRERAYLILIVLLIIIPYFLFNVGFIHLISVGHVDVRGVPRSNALTPWSGDNPYFNKKEVTGAEWLAKVSDEDAVVAADSYGVDLIGFYRRRFLLSLQKDTPQKAYIYLRTWNIEKQEVYVYLRAEVTDHINLKDEPKLLNDFNNRNRIYDNGGAQILNPKERSF